MKNFTFDVKITGYEQVTVSAKNLKEAEEKALNRFDEIYKKQPLSDLRTKSYELQRLGRDFNYDEDEL